MRELKLKKRETMGTKNVFKPFYFHLIVSIKFFIIKKINMYHFHLIVSIEFFNNKKLKSTFYNII